MLPNNPLLFTVLLTGSGAVQESWKPICRALHLPHLTKPLSKGVVNTLLADIVYKRRFAYLSDSNDTVVQSTSDRVMQTFKDAICQELIIARQNNEIKVQVEFNDIMYKVVLPDTKALASITTNWDLVIDEALQSFPTFKNHSKKPPTMHIHGSVSEPSGLYLPTEIIRESYRKESEVAILEKMIYEVMTYLKIAKKIIIYGLSISALDAELLQVINQSFDNKNLSEIIVIDNYPTSVIEKLQLMNFASTPVSIKGYYPHDLTNPIN